MPFAATQMQLEITILSEVSQKNKIPYDITYMWNLRYYMNLSTKQTQTQRTDLWLPKWMWGRGWMDWEFGIGLIDTNYYIQKE